MRNYQISLFVCFLFLSFSLNAQDIVRTKKDTIRAKVVEIGIEEIKYKDFNNLEGPVFVLPKTDVIEITYENGTKTLLKPDVYDVSDAATAMRKKTRAIKYEFLSPLGGDMVFGYETMVKVGINLEFKIGLIGVGFGENAKESSGASIKAGVKFLTRPSYVQRGIKYAHGLAGFYIKPELIFNSYSKDEARINYNTYPQTTENVEMDITNFAINLVFGKQYILGNTFTIDFYGGIGYGTRSGYEDNTGYYYYDGNESYEYSHLYGGDESPFVMTGGLTLGVLF